MKPQKEKHVRGPIAKERGLMELELSNINYLAVVVAVLINMVGGAAWYGILANPWMAEVGLHKEELSADRAGMVRG
ncbi:MAG: DUF1761 domain-containing protein [SAR202 cluster bacterium]|nr:DUF1761 domain-containing protein [SAR202 cluster bacterium]|tara:strand:+ start:67 stop:294 length:228 start_codon:yes stop_codon:yes gene_type:complete